MSNIKFQGNTKFEDLKVGDEYLNVFTNLKSKVLRLTSSSVEMYNLVDIRSKDQNGYLKGINSTNWYDVKLFNRQFKNIGVD